MKKPGLTKNITLKIGSLVFAVLLWIIVTNINDPVDSKTFDNVPVRIMNTQILDDSNRVFEVLEDTDIIDRVTVRAPRSVIGRITAANIVARADINDISSLDTIAITLEVNNVSSSEINEITGTSNILKLSIEEKRTRTLPIQVVVGGEITEGYLQGNATVEPNIISISGPESLIDRVSAATVSVDITNFTSVISTTADITLYDSDGRRVSVDRISQNIRSASIRIPILEIRDISLRYSVMGTPAAGYRRNGNDHISARQIEVAGISYDLREFNTINIPPEMIDISDSTESFWHEFDLREFLPEGVRLVEPLEYMVEVTIGIEAEESRTITLRESNFTVINMPDGFEANLGEVDELPSLYLVGLRSDLDAVEISSIRIELDIAALMQEREMEEMREGVYGFPVSVNLGPDIAVTNSPVVLLGINAIE